MISLFGKCQRPLAFFMASFLSAMMLIFGNPVIQPALAGGNGINVILMIGDGMGWNIARSAAIAKGGAFYTAGKGSGLSFQTLSGYALVTTYGTTIEGSTSVKSTGNSALDGSNSLTGASPVRAGFSFQHTPFNPGTTINGDTSLPGNLAGYDVTKGGPTPWIPLSPANPGSYDKEYIKYSYPDSANTATTLYTGVKSYNNAMGVDIYEQKLKTIVEIAKEQGKSTGVVTSVPVSHATPGAAVSFVNRRNKYDSDYDPNKANQDSILQQALLDFQPNVILGGGHPLDHQNATSSGPVCNNTSYTYIKASTYKELTGKTALSDAAACSAPASSNPNNRYGYTFLERGPNATQTLLNTAASVNPNTGGKLFGLYGTRGQDGNIPTSSSKGDYSTTGLGQFTLFSSTTSTNQTPNPDTVRPLSPGETNASFIAREINENPTLADMTQAALTVLGKDQDGFWLMVEGGDIDWAAHDNNMDNLIGTMNDFDKAVQTTINWINNNGGWSKNLLIVTADHDHYLTLNPNFPSKLTAQDPNLSRGLKFNAKDITFNQHLSANAGHFWGSDPSKKYLWGSHSRRIVPVYYQGAYSSTLTKLLGQGFQMTDSSGTYSVPGIRGVVDQSQIFQAMNTALTTGANPPG
ncbi:alkaline phosphatase [Anabaena minutissima FACHB-250]|nr:alkaline phosphatase [Anabaena minutissima FACHB-250]